MTDARVARLRLTAADDAQVRRGAILVEDAMRIATLAPDSDRRSYIVRHLDVGVIDPDAAPNTLALQIERRLAHVQATAVPATSPGAATARAVYFPDDVTAIAELARELARHGTPSAWFWPHVADGAVKLPTPIEALRACLRLAAARIEGPLAIAAVIDAADPIDAPIAHALLASLTPADGTALVHATFGANVSLAGLPSTHPDILAILTPRWRARLAHWVAQWGPDARALWLAAIAAIASRGSIGTVPAELACARQLVGAVIAAAHTRSRPDPVHEVPAAPIVIAEHQPPPLRDAPMIEESTIETLAAGALFLIRPLAMLGIVEWLDAHPWTAGVNWPAQLIASIAAAHAGTDDALANALSADPPLDGPFVAPSRWRALVGRRPHKLRRTPHGHVLEGFGHLPLATWHGEPPEMAWRDHPSLLAAPAPPRAFAAFAWQRALARYLRTYLGLRLHDVVRRTATITSTPTHLELVLPLRAADARIRKAGLDIDPGWVPWLGRVVRFHYRGNPRTP